MLRRQLLAHCFLFIFAACGIVFAQEQPPAKHPAASVPITVAATGERVRFTAVGPVERMRLEVFDTSGSPVFDTGQTNNRAQFSILNTDSVADPSNVEFATFRARGTDFVFGSGKTGTGVNRPLMLAAGFLTDNVTNDKQLVLATSGRVGVGTDSPDAKLTVFQNSDSDAAGAFEINNGSNGENALVAETNGSGFAGRFIGNGSSAKGVSIEAGDEQIGLQVVQGRIVLSYASVADGGTIPSDVAVVEVADNGMASNTPSVALPATAENGTVIIVGTPDPDGAQITGAVSGPHSITNVTTLTFTRIGGAWRHEF